MYVVTIIGNKNIYDTPTLFANNNNNVNIGPSQLVQTAITATIIIENYETCIKQKKPIFACIELWSIWKYSQDNVNCPS